ncbi:MAG TPA: phosphatase PAP2 family protein [Halothiobacillus sp.]|nr:phosphatase PAP2 family protein [Halothiobacillus sp.]HQS29225.1 phosphatase PAP2 family protein [Halothiobacillus sp.]HUN00615.1 phosphatase PAP2 family protein [Halothiobacillus sp.]
MTIHRGDGLWGLVAVPKGECQMVFNEHNALNQALFLQINAGLLTPDWLIAGAIFVAQYLIFLLPALLLILWLWGGDARRAVAFKALSVALLALGINLLIGWGWPEPRPFMMGVGHTWIAHAADASFPSDHMTVFMSVGLTFLLSGLWGFGLVILLGSLAVAWARVFLGVHFPLDMLGSVLVATGSYFVVFWGWPRGGKRLLAWAEHIYRVLLARPIRIGWVRR